MAFPKIDYGKYPYLRNIGGELTLPDETIADFVPAGWKSLFKKMLDNINAELDAHGVLRAHLQILQIKEKFGSLHFYYALDDTVPDAVNAKVADIVDRACAESEKVCVICGAKAEYLSTGWILPYCGICAHNHHEASNARHKTNFEFSKSWAKISK